MQKQFGIDLEFDHSTATVESLTNAVRDEVKRTYDQQKKEIGEHWPQMQKMILLQTLDMRWKDHLKIIDYLQDAVRLRFTAQQDPLVQYKTEGFAAFERMNEVIASEVIEKLIKVRILSPEEAEEANRFEMEWRRRQGQQQFNYQGSEASEGASFLNQAPGVNAATQSGSERNGAGYGATPAGMPSEAEFARDDMMNSEPKMNRAQRRAMERKKHKRA